MSWPKWADEMYLDLLDFPTKAHGKFTPVEKKIIAEVGPLFEMLSEAYAEPVSDAQDQLLHRLMYDRMDEYYRVTARHLNTQHRSPRVVPQKPWQEHHDANPEWLVLTAKEIQRECDLLGIPAPTDSQLSRHRNKSN